MRRQSPTAAINFIIEEDAVVAEELSLSRLGGLNTVTVYPL